MPGGDGGLRRQIDAFLTPLRKRIGGAFAAAVLIFAAAFFLAGRQHLGDLLRGFWTQCAIVFDKETHTHAFIGPRGSRDAEGVLITLRIRRSPPNELDVNLEADGAFVFKQLALVANESRSIVRESHPLEDAPSAHAIDFDPEPLSGYGVAYYRANAPDRCLGEGNDFPECADHLGVRLTHLHINTPYRLFAETPPLSNAVFDDITLAIKQRFTGDAASEGRSCTPLRSGSYAMLMFGGAATELALVFAAIFALLTLYPKLAKKGDGE